MMIPKGLCQCGCGAKTNLAPQTRKRKGIKKGDPLNFISGHYRNTKRTNWRGGRSSDGQGYQLIWMPSHPRADKKGYVSEHVMIAERAFGKQLPPGAEVHHANGSRDSGPLVICQDRAYHMLLHRRMRAYKACGHVNWKHCPKCDQWMPPEKFYVPRRGRATCYCKACISIKYHARKNESGQAVLKFLAGQPDIT